MSKDNSQQWSVLNEGGKRYLRVEYRGRTAQISADELRKKGLLKKLCGHDYSKARKKSHINYTPRQLEVVEFIREFRDEKGISPTLEEIAERFGVSKITAYGHINQLERKGAIKREKYRARSATISDPAYR